MIDKPTDLVMIFGVAAIVVTIFGYGYLDMVVLGANNQSTTIFTNVTNYATGTAYMGGAGAETSKTLEAAPSSDTTSDGFLTQMVTSLLKVGKVWSGMTHAMRETWSELQLPAEVLTILISMIVLATAFALYVWWRGSG